MHSGIVKPVVCPGIACLMLLGAIGCGGLHTEVPGDETAGRLASEKVTVEAYLFDARLKRYKKPTSFRLEVYQTDSVIALGGRAYLGKGALKGRLTPDSLEVYFPRSNEFLYDAVSALLASAECSLSTVEVNLVHLFESLPDSVTWPDGLRISADYSDSDRPMYLLDVPGCGWSLEVSYDQRDAGWRLREFYFDDGSEVTLKAKRRTYKSRASVPGSKFVVTPPPDASRVSP